MKFIVRYHITDQDKYLPLVKKWAALSSDQRANEPGEGIRKIAHWADIGCPRGVVVVESSDPIAVATWCGRWNPHLETEVTPVVDEDELGLVSQRIADAVS